MEGGEKIGKLFLNRVRKQETGRYRDYVGLIEEVNAVFASFLGKLKFHTMY